MKLLTSSTKVVGLMSRFCVLQASLCWLSLPQRYLVSNCLLVLPLNLQLVPGRSPLVMDSGDSRRWPLWLVYVLHRPRYHVQKLQLGDTYRRNVGASSSSGRSLECTGAHRVGEVRSLEPGQCAEGQFNHMHMQGLRRTRCALTSPGSKVGGPANASSRRGDNSAPGATRYCRTYHVQPQRSSRA